MSALEIPRASHSQQVPKEICLIPATLNPWLIRDSFGRLWLGLHPVYLVRPQVLLIQPVLPACVTCLCLPRPGYCPERVLTQLPRFPLCLSLAIHTQVFRLLQKALHPSCHPNSSYLLINSKEKCLWQSPPKPKNPRQHITHRAVTSRNAKTVDLVFLPKICH